MLKSLSMAIIGELPSTGRFILRKGNLAFEIDGHHTVLNSWGFAIMSSALVCRFGLQGSRRSDDDFLAVLPDGLKFTIDGGYFIYHDR